MWLKVRVFISVIKEKWLKIVWNKETTFHVKHSFVNFFIREYYLFVSKTQKQEIGELGEKLSSLFLLSKGFQVIETNYRKKWGEIDIIVKKEGKIHFVEVKTVSLNQVKDEVVSDRKNIFETKAFLNGCKNILLSVFFLPEKSYTIKEVTHETGKGEASDEYRPEDNLHLWKLKRLKRAINSYLAEKKIREETDWQFDAVTVRLDSEKKIAKIEYLEDIIL